MEKLRTAATVALMAGLVGGAYWVSMPREQAKGDKVSALPQITKCRPHDDCARMARSKASLLEASMSP